MAANQSLVSFVREKAERPAGADDWKMRRLKWHRNITGLYRMVRAWLRPLESEKAIRIEESKLTLQEDHHGAYPVPCLHVLVGDQKVSFRPKGTLVVGAQGRVDVSGDRGVAMLVVKDGRWSIVRRTDRVEFVPFAEDSFRDLLEEVMA